MGFRSTKTDLGTLSCTRLLEESVTAVFTTLPVSPQVPLSHQAKYHFLGRTTNLHSYYANTHRNTLTLKHARKHVANRYTWHLVS